MRSEGATDSGHRRLRFKIEQKGLMRMATVRQCPQCELRFTNSNELEDHLATDHGQSEPEPREDSR
jgi:hypothetical protein